MKRRGRVRCVICHVVDVCGNCSAHVSAEQLFAVQFHNMINTERGVISATCAVVVERLSDKQISMHLGSSQPLNAMKEDFQKHTTFFGETNPDTGQDETNKTEAGSSIGSKEESEQFVGNECDKDLTNKQDVVKLSRENVFHTSQSETPPRKKRRKERESVEHSIVKQNQSSNLPLSDHTKRKTKKMAEMQDFLERERNVSLLNDLCKSKFGGLRKKMKKHVPLSDKHLSASSYDRLNYSFSSETINSYDTDSIDASKESDISHLYPKITSCGEEPQIKGFQDISENKMPNEATSMNVCLASNETKDSNLEINEDNGNFNDTVECEESAETKLYNPSLIKKEIEIGDSRTCMNEENESFGLNLLISDVKGSAWIDPDCYSSDESALIIDESVDTHDTYFCDGDLRESLKKNSKTSENNLSKRVTNTETQGRSPLEHSEFQSKINTPNTTIKSGSTSDSVNSHSSLSQSSERPQLHKAVQSPTIKIQSPSQINYKNPKVDDKNQNSIDCYVIEVQEEVIQKDDPFQRPSSLKDAPIRKIKLKKVDKKEKKSTSVKQKPNPSSSKRNGNSKDYGRKPSSTNTDLKEADVIIDLDNYVETQKEDLTDKDAESAKKLKNNSQRIPGNTSEQLSSLSNVNIVSSSKKDSSSEYFSSQSFTHHQHKVKQKTEFNVLRRHLESGDFNRKFTTIRDLRTSKTSFNTGEPLGIKARGRDRIIPDDNQTSGSHFYSCDTDIPWQTPFGEFNKVISVIYRELLTPHSQHLMGQLTEILYLVISESVRYSDRCKKARLLMSAELVVEEQVLAHRDFQANTIFYGMYFTHLFKNVVQCFPETKEFHTFMYLALFVNFARRLKSNYNVHSSYLHIARKLVVSMLKANSYDDITVFSAICKPDPVFETDFILVSQLIDSFAGFIEKPFLRETNYLLQSSQYNHNFKPTMIPSGPSRKILHPEFPPTRLNVIPTVVDPTQNTFQSQLHSFSFQTKQHSKEETHLQNDHTILFKNTKFASSRDPRAWGHSFELEKTNDGKSRSQTNLVTEPRTPVTQDMVSACSATSLLPSTPTSNSDSTPRTPFTSDSPSSKPVSTPANSSAVHPATSSSVPRMDLTSATTSIPTASPTDFSESSISEKTQASNSRVTSQSGFEESKSTDVHVWKPTAIRPRFRPCLPYYPPAPLLINTLISPPTFGNNCL